MVSHTGYVRATRFGLAMLRGRIFLLPLLWVMVAVEIPLKLEALVLCFVGFNILRDTLMFRLLNVVTFGSELHVTLSRVKVRQRVYVW